jgi:hypothetical protein
MHVDHPRRRSLLAIPVLWVAALLAVCSSATAAVATVTPTPPPKSKLHAPRLGGKWSGQYSGAFTGTFTLQWRQAKASKKGVSLLRGTITLTSPSGTYAITGSVRRSSIKFGAVAVGATYKGSWSGKSMSGTYSSPQGGGPWSAKKTS